jgi:hypothetical protein
MEKRHPKVVLTARDADDAIVLVLELTPEEWYGGERPLIDSDEECRRLSARTIEGYETEEDGKIFLRWRNTYDAGGHQNDSEVLQDDWEPTIPSPPPGQSALDQLRRLGLFPPKGPPEGDDDERQLKLPVDGN